MLRPEEIQKAFDKMEHDISINTQFINSLMAFISVSEQFNNKVLNKCFTDALKDTLKENFNVYDFKYSYKKDALDFPVYIKGIHGTSHYFRFPIDKCFTETESGKLRISSKGFREQCQIIRENLTAENARIRSEIEIVYQMLADAQELKKKADEYYNKYSYSLKERFKCNYTLKTL